MGGVREEVTPGVVDVGSRVKRKKKENGNKRIKKKYCKRNNKRTREGSNIRISLA